MDLDTQRRIWIEKQRGFQLVECMQREQNRHMTTEERFCVFCRLMEMAERMGLPQPTWDDDEEVTRRWMKVRERWDAARLIPRDGDGSP